MSTTVTYLKNYEPPVFALDSIDLEFSLYDDYAHVISSMRCRRLHSGDFLLHGEDLELVSIACDGKPIPETDYQWQGENLCLINCPNQFTLTIKTKIYPQNNTKLSGLYRTNQLFCTQCEAEGFRRITYFPDRPDVLTVFTTKISADKTHYPRLLSNGNCIDKGEEDNNRHWVLWQDPFKKPSYLFALVAGTLACVEDQFTTCSGKVVDLKIYVEPGNEDKCDHAMQSIKRAMRWDEEQYGREYDLSVFMIVAVSDFNMGAMENKGLNIFNTKYILARPDNATDQDFINIESVVGHEYFHNWTGNRVTCRDWFQLSLKEGLTVFRDQEFSSDMNSRAVTRIRDVQALLVSQFPEDAGSMAHPVRPESYQEINNFYTATIYNKGAEVIRMQHSLLGAEGFRRGMDLYFERHDGQAVTIDDFVAAMADANNTNLEMFKRWYSQAGTPVVTVDTSYADGNYTITLTQTCPPTRENAQKEPFHIPVRFSLFSDKGEIIICQQIMELKKTRQSFRFVTPEKPLLSLLQNFSAPIKLVYSAPYESRLALLRFESDGYAKWSISQKLVIECIHGIMSASESVNVCPKLLAALAAVLQQDDLDLSLRAIILTPPSFEEVVADLSAIDVDAVEAARDEYSQQLGRALWEKAAFMVKDLEQKAAFGQEAQAYAARHLRNLCLYLMMKADGANAFERCQNQYANARTMTDQIAALSLLVNYKLEKATDALAAFYQQWQDDALVLDKWFAVQASARHPHTLSQVRSLLKHPHFSIKNPNKVRALVGAFTQANPRNFHSPDGSGYTFLTEMILLLDPINAQIAARLATAFTHWRRYDRPRQQLMQQQLLQLNACNLSRDVSEIITNSLTASNQDE